MSASGRYGVNVLPEQGRELSRHFARPAGATPSRLRNRGRPAAAVELRGLFRLRGDAMIEVSDHTLFIAEVSECDYCDSLPLVFFSSRYHLAGKPVDH